MATLDLFNNQETKVVETKKETVLDLTPDTKVEETSKDVDLDLTGFIQAIEKDPDRKITMTIPGNPVYFGQSFEYLGLWKADTDYYRDEYRISFVSFENCLLACNRTHKSSEELKPVIQYDDNGKPVAVDNVYWELVITGVNNSPASDKLNNSILLLEAKLAKSDKNITTNSKAITVLGKSVLDAQSDISTLQQESDEYAKDIKSIKASMDANIAYPWIGTEDEYLALEEKDPNKFYYIYEE